jgi:hypothetical protein
LDKVKELKLNNILMKLLKVDFGFFFRIVIYIHLGCLNLKELLKIGNLKLFIEILDYGLLHNHLRNSLYQYYNLELK